MRMGHWLVRSIVLISHNIMAYPVTRWKAILCEPDGNLTFGPCSDSAKFLNVNDFQDQDYNASMHDDLSSFGQVFLGETK